MKKDSYIIINCNNSTNIKKKNCKKLHKKFESNNITIDKYKIILTVNKNIFNFGPDFNNS